MDLQLRLDLPAPSLPPGALRLWVLADGGGAVPNDHRHLFVDALDAAPMVAPGDLILVRQGAGTYVALGPEPLSPPARRAVLDHLVATLVAPSLSTQRVSDVRETLHIALTPGRSRGALAEADDVRSRSSFEHALLRVAGRLGVCGLPDALRAAHLADRALNSDTHPVVHGIFRREHGDMLNQLYAETGDDAYRLAAVPAYRRAAEAFARLGLRHQSGAARRRADQLLGDAEQPWLPHLRRPLANTIAAAALGYAVRRLCGFAIALEAPGIWSAPVVDAAVPYVVLGEITLSDSEAVEILAGAPSPRRRAIAIVHACNGRISVRTGLSDEMHAVLGVLPDDADQADVTSIVLECETLTLDGRGRAVAPAGPVTFVARGSGKPHHLAVRFAMAQDDDLVLTFRLTRPPRVPRAYI